MSVLFLFTIIIVSLAIGIETISLLLQLQGIMNQIFQNKAFLVHSSVTLFLWSLSFISLGLLQFESNHPIIHNFLLLKLVGIILLCFGLITAIWGSKLLGIRRSLCENFFKGDVEVVTTSLYKYIKNPEDYGLWIALIGFSFLTNSLFNLIISCEFIMLMIPHQIIENIPIKRHYRKSKRK